MYVMTVSNFTSLNFQSGVVDGALVNGLDGVTAATQGISELTFEEDEEDQFYMKDLPKHACA